MRNVIIVIIAVFIIWGIYYLMKPTPLPSPSKDKPTEPASSNTTKPTTANQ
ncbi:MAG: hypothetical protein HY762_03985, partial [Planctomycetes bacterium]|nr:hypothetical protein [Planctomycetota bacterium]